MLTIILKYLTIIKSDIKHSKYKNK